MEEPKGITQRLEETTQDMAKIKDALGIKDGSNTPSKVKFWKLPFGKRSISKKKKLDGYVLFINIGTNKAMSFIKAPIQDNVALVNGIPHVVEPEDIFLYKNKLPVVIQPEWSEKPFSAKEHFNQTKEKGETTEGWIYIMNYILKTQITEKKKVPMGMLIVGGLIVVGLGYYLWKSGALKA